MVPRSSRIPNESNVAKSHRGWILCNMATANGEGSKKALSLNIEKMPKGVRSTKAQLEEPLEIQTAEAVLKELRKKHRDVFVQIKDVTEMVYSDQTG
jgi:hypothetical protein